MSTEAELIILGGLLQSNHLIKDMPESLHAGQFSDPWVADMVFRVAEGIHSGGFDSKLFLMALPAEDGHMAMNIMAKGYGVYRLDAYCDLVQESFRRRALGEIVSSIHEAVTKEDDTLALIAEVQKQLEDMAEPQRKSQFTDREAAQIIFDQMRDGSRATSTGLPSLDEAMGGGMYPGKAYGVVARKKIGKTILACTISHNLEEKHLFICGEMGAAEIHERVLARQMDVFPSGFRNETRKEHWFQSKLAEALVSSKGHVIYQDAPGLSFNQLRRILNTAVMKHKIKGFILDYWQLVGGKSGKVSTSEHLDEVTQYIATFCRKHRVWALVMGQENQEGNTRGGEGMRLAFDQVYRLGRANDQPNAPQAYLEMMDTRYTPWQNCGDKDNPYFNLEEKGPYFSQIYD